MLFEKMMMHVMPIVPFATNRSTQRIGSDSQSECGRNMLCVALRLKQEEMQEAVYLSSWWNTMPFYADTRSKS